MFGLFKKKYVPHPTASDPDAKQREIVGESFHKRNVEAMYNAHILRGAPVWVTLVAEPQNKFDRNAIRVDWVDPSNGRTVAVGHIAKDKTRYWRSTISSAPSGSRWMWPARVAGTPDTYLGVVFYGSPTK